MAQEFGDLQLRRLQFKSHGSTLEVRRRNAVCVRHAYKHYGSLKRSPVNVLEDLNMTVPRGNIYGLLGASGCGKTTLINCIVGRKRLKSGEIWVLGGTPDTRGSGVPGPRIGYMPQDVSLYGDFTIRESMKYFGWITDMLTEEIEERLEFLRQLLQLPDIDILIKFLSGGQQRRVSLAVALLHQPELLILDEPTVGLDPILREIIWAHLLEITRLKETTVILTTHYIDETRQANLIGLMRGGYIIAEESPQKLLSVCKTQTLEEAFLKLSIVQNLPRHRRSSMAQEVTNRVSLPTGIINPAAVIDDINCDDIPEISGEFGDHVAGGLGLSRRGSLLSVKDNPLPKLPIEEARRTRALDYLLNFKLNRIKALVWKNFLWLLRNLPLLLLIVAIPPITTGLFYSCIGRDPQNLDIAMVNYETKNAACNKTISCNGTQLSCGYLGYLEQRSVNLIPYDSEEEALQAVLHGKTYASIVVRHNYSEALKSRIENFAEQKEWDIMSSTIDVFRDVAVKDIATILKLHMYESLNLFLKEYMESCGESAEGLQPPVKFQTPVYGIERPQYSDFTTPGVVLLITFFAALGNAGFAMLTERKEGILERSLVAGVNPLELIFAHTIVDSVVVLCQVAATLIVTFAILNMTVNGPFVLVIITTVLCGICGMFFGFTISCAVNTEYVAMSIVLGLFIPIFMISGVIWPIEGMHIVLQKIGAIGPFAKPVEGMRSILQRGWGISEPAVYDAFIVLAIWIIVFVILSTVCLKFKKG